MKFSFSQRGKREDTRYAYVKAPVAETQGQLFTALLSASLGTAQSGPPALNAIRKEIRLSDPEFVAGLAIYFNEKEQPLFRNLAILLTAELAAWKTHQEKTALLVSRILRQPSDITKWLGYFTESARSGQRPARAIRKELTALLNRQDEYQYSRCSRETRSGIRNAIRLLSPKPADRTRKNLFARILRDQIPLRTTWEQEWHALYQQNYDSAEQRQFMLRDKWKEGISSFRVGYTALLNNLRPMLCCGVSGKVLKLAAEYLGNAAAVRRSGISSLHLLEVYRDLRRLDHDAVGRLSEALEQAARYGSWAHSPFGSEGISVIAMDVSNSMKHPIDDIAGTHLATPAQRAAATDPAVHSYPAASGVQRFDIAPLLALSWISRGSHVIPGILGNTWRNLDLPDRPILMSVDSFRTHEGEAGYGFNVWLVLQDLLKKRQVVDRILIFTDCRLWDNRFYHQPAGSDPGHWWRQYRRQVAPNAKLYLFDLAGYGARSLDCLEDNVFLIAGWKEGILDILDTFDRTVEPTEPIHEIKG